MRARPLSLRLLGAQLLVAVVALASLGVTLDRIFERRALDDLKNRLVAEGRLVQTTIERTGIDEPLVRRAGAASGARITIIRSDGVVLADSEHDPATMANHSDRPEFKRAIAGEIGTSQRVSDTLGKPFLYVALPPRDGVVVRAALPADRVGAQRRAVRRTLLYAFLATTALAAVVSGLTALTVSRPLRRMTEEVGRVAAGQTRAVEARGPAEARALAAAVNDMAAAIAIRVDELGSETALREQILSAMNEAVMLADRRRVVYANPSARAMFGVRDGDPLPAAVPETGVEERDIRHPARRAVRIGVATLNDGRELIVAQDVTEAKRLDAVRRDFVANASHEMKTPVAGILATAETLENAIADDPESARRFAGSLVREARRLSALITGLLDLARLEEPIAEPRSVSLAEIARGCAAEMEASAGAAAVTLSVRADDVAVNGRGEDLVLMVRNLVDNAVRHTSAGGTVNVDVSARGRTAVLTVSDTGVGIAQKDLPRIFERFFRVDQARARDTGGTGLGLAIVRHVAETHGGTVEVDSELGRGSTFTVTLPAL